MTASSGTIASHCSSVSTKGSMRWTLGGGRPGGNRFSAGSGPLTGDNARTSEQRTTGAACDGAADSRGGGRQDAGAAAPVTADQPRGRTSDCTAASLRQSLETMLAWARASSSVRVRAWSAVGSVPLIAGATLWASVIVSR